MIEEGQDAAIWTEWWLNSSTEHEIRQWDYYGLRPWILKFAPRYGKTLEAGCGLARWCFYLSKMGIDIEGVDFSQPTIEYLNAWQKENDFNLRFTKGDVQHLPYQNDSLSGYLSFGVVEHFIEGPHRPIQEAFRVLRPGGIAIITTPSKSWFTFYRKTKTNLKKLVKKLLGRTIVSPAFFQYEYRPRKLKKYVKNTYFSCSGVSPKGMSPGMA